MPTTPTEPTPDDLVATFQIEDQPVRGRITRLGPAFDEVLTRHAYPEAVANLLGEACALAALVGSSLKFDGRLIVQAQGSGPVAYVVADYDTGGALRGYCRFDAERVAKASEGFVRPAQSEQIPTRVRLAVGQADVGEGFHWRAGGLLIQNIAEDATRGETREAWTRAQAFFETLGEDELLDPALSSERLLFRLFHEDGVRLLPATPLNGFCRCSHERIVEMLQTFPPEERAQMVEPDGQIHVTCEYCSRVYALAPAAVA